MKIDTITKKNDEYYTPEYAIKPILKHIKNKSVIWCPFDTNQSLFVKVLSENGHDVINTHIDDGNDFFNLNFDCDYIISNPPYSIKYDVFNRLFYLKKPFAMLTGIVGLFESQKRFNLFKNNEFEIMYLNKRVSFFNDYNDKRLIINPPFSSAYITSRMLPCRILFEEIEK